MIMLVYGYIILVLETIETIVMLSSHVFDVQSLISCGIREGSRCTFSDF